MELIIKAINVIRANAARIAVLVLGVLLALALARVGELRQERSDLREIVEQERQEAAVWRDRYGKAHAQVQVLQVDKDNMEKLYSRQIKELTHIKPRQVASVTHLGTENKGSVRVPVSAQTKEFQYNQDNWLKLRGSVLGDSVHLDFEVKDSLTFVTGYKKRLFGRDTYLVEAISHNPATSFTSLRRVELRERPKRFGIGGGIYYTPAGVTVGVGIQYNIIRF